jgi:hypothetical protein
MLVYKISSNESDNCYIGSSKYKYPCQRMASHKCHYRRYLDNRSKFYTVCKLFDEVGIDNCKIEVIENVLDFSQLRRQERYHILNTQNCVNKNIPQT